MKLALILSLERLASKHVSISNLIAEAAQCHKTARGMARHIRTAALARTSYEWESKAYREAHLNLLRALSANPGEALAYCARVLAAKGLVEEDGDE